jgi:hypothetical protein
MSTRPDALFNLADAMAEDILNTPDDEVLREVEEDFGDPRALANKFDQILERAEKQVFGTERSAASPQVRSSVLDLPASLPHETIRWVKGFDLGSRILEFLSSLSPRTLAWSATAAAVVILVQAAVITAVIVKEQGAPSGESLATPGSSDQSASLERETDNAPPRAKTPGPVAVQSDSLPVAVTPMEVQPSFAPTPKLSDEEIAALVAGGRQLIVAGDIPNARLVLQQAAEAGNATAALELGATYDPIELAKLGVRDGSLPAASIKGKALPDIAMARTWYQKAKDLGSTEAQGRLENLARRDRPKR